MKSPILTINRRRSLFSYSRWRLIALCLLVGTAAARAQSGLVEARVLSVSGRVSLISAARGGPLAIRKGATLAPGDQVDTTLGGRVVIVLTDGGQVIVHPGSRVLLKDFRAAGSARELLEILAGRVRFKIYQLGGRPNPYRVNSPTALIAVRGTDFLVNVESSGETQVIVYEGLVEVTSRFSPRQRTLVEPGRSVIVRPSGDISLAAPGLGPGGELNATAKLDFGEVSPMNEIVGSIQTQYLDGFVGATTDPAPSRYTAFADSHFDSLENPAYATEFARAEGRLYLTPSFSNASEFRDTANTALIEPVHPLDHTLSSQTSFFTPLGATRFVIGGGASVARADLQGFRIEDQVFRDNPITYSDRDSAILTTTNASFIIARRFGESGRLGLGLKFDYLAGRVGATTTLTQAIEDDAFVTRSEYGARIDRRRLTLGLSYDFLGGKKLGVYFRRGSTSGLYTERHWASDADYRSLVETNQAEERHTPRAAELGVRWRSPLTRRLFYGIEGSLLYQWGRASGQVIDLMSGLKNSGASRRRVSRATLGGGIGYAPRPQTVFSLDLAGGSYFNADQEADPKLPESARRTRAHFLTLQAGAQTDIGRRFFVQGSWLGATKWSLSTIDIIAPPHIKSSHRSDSDTRYFSILGAGYRLRPNLLAQYLFSTSFRNTTPSHTLMLRYNFDFGGGR